MSTEPSSRIPTDPNFRYSWYAKLIFANQRRRYGKELEPARLWARTSKVFAALSLLYGALDRRRSPIEPALRSLITVRDSQINWCAFCVDINSATGLKRGVSDAQLAALAEFETSPLFDERQKAAPVATDDSILWKARHDQLLQRFVALDAKCRKMAAQLHDLGADVD